MANNIIYGLHKLPFVEDESYQTFGEFIFYPNGGKKLGPSFFAYGTPIHRFRFGADLIASESIDEPNIVAIETPIGGLRFQYRPLFRTWYQIVEVEDPRLYLHQERYGTLVAIALYHLRCEIRWALVKTLHIVVVVLGLALFAYIAKSFD